MVCQRTKARNADDGYRLRKATAPIWKSSESSLIRASLREQDQWQATALAWHGVAGSSTPRDVFGPGRKSEKEKKSTPVKSLSVFPQLARINVRSTAS